MIDDNGCLITIGHLDDMKNMFGRLEVNPNPSAQLVWKLFRDNPKMYQFGVEYIEDTKTGKCELIGLSMILKTMEKKIDD
jgi:hypothetical protein